MKKTFVFAFAAGILIVAISSPARAASAAADTQKQPVSQSASAQPLPQKEAEGRASAQPLPQKEAEGRASAQPLPQKEAEGRASAQPAAAQASPEPKYIGEFAGWKVQVPYGNYYFVKGAISVFGTRWGAEPQTEQEFEDRTWDQLVLSFEAYRRNITVEQKDVDAEITKMLTAAKATFDRTKDRAAYESWVKERTKEPVELFENQLRHLIQLEKLRQQVLDSFKVAVTEDEALQEFRNEYNTLELQLVQFDDLEKAKEFYGKMRDPKAWDEAEAKDPKFCRRPGFVSLEFLINMWKIPKDDCYKMMGMPVDSVYPPTPVWKGYGVFRIVKQRPADDKEFAKLRDSYFKQVEMNKKYEELGSWLKKLKNEAGIMLYPVKTAEKK